MTNKTNYRPQDLIAEPCSEKWCEMPGDEQKRFCEKCQHSVVDLTGKSLEEIQILKNKANGRLCGRFELPQEGLRKLAIGAGVASLALASCNKPNSDLVVGEIGNASCPQPTKNQQDSSSTPEPLENKHSQEEPEDKVVPSEKIEVPMILGMICPPASTPPKQA